jgi:nucleoside-diphosphate-sugar epimerase
MKRVLVTGAGGYIGSTLTPMLLGSGYDVVALDRFFFGRETLPRANGKFTVLQNDIRWTAPSVFHGVDAVIDLAALSNDPLGEIAPDKTWEINHRGRARIAQLAKNTGVKKYILPSSCSIYGFQEGVLDETAKPNPLTVYAKANLQAEADILSLANDNFCAVVIRQSTVYGLSPRMRFDLAVNGMVHGFFKNGKIPILRDGTQWRPFVHVKDTSRAMMMLLEAPVEQINGHIFNVGSEDQNYQILPLAKIVADAIGVEFQYEWYGLPDHRSYQVSFRKISAILGYKTLYTPADAAREIYAALKEGGLNPDDPKTITVQWYKHLLDMHQLLKGVEINGVLL